MSKKMPKFKAGTCCFSDYDKRRKVVILKVVYLGIGVFDYLVEGYPYNTETEGEKRCRWRIDVLPFESEYREATNIERVILFDEEHAFVDEGSNDRD